LVGNYKTQQNGRNGGEPLTDQREKNATTAAVPEFLEGTLEEITYYHEGNYFMVGKLNCPSYRELVTFVGYLPLVQLGESLRLKGGWKVHRKYGRQFQVESWESSIPASVEGIRRFLASGFIKGIGPVLAGKLVDCFKEKTLEVMENEPHLLTRVEGIGEKKAQAIAESFRQRQEIKEIIFVLQKYHINPGLALRLFRHYGSQTVKVLQENPYRPAEEVHGIGFITADKIARQMGLSPHAPSRVRACFYYLLERSAEEGHVYMPEDMLIKKVLELLETDEGTVPEELVREKLEELLQQGRLSAEKLAEGVHAIYLAPYYHAEKGVSLYLRDLLKSFNSPQQDITVKMDTIPGDIKLAAEQKKALEMCSQTGVLIITGGPGTGKTTTICALLHFFQSQGKKVALAAPTGRAAKRMTEATGMEAKTIHRLLEYSFQEGRGFSFGRHEERPLEVDALVVDEASMIDLMLMYNLLKAVPRGCQLILVGDMDQLPSVGAGNVLRDLINSEVIPCVRLHTIFRQAQESLITVNAHRINQGKFPYLNRKGKDFFFIQEEKPEAVRQIIVDLCRERLPSYGGYDPLEDIQVLTPMRRTEVGVEKLNKVLQEALNPPARHKGEIAYGGSIFRLGDRLMQIRNNYEKEVFNGDIGRLVDIDQEEGMIMVRYPDIYGPRDVAYEVSELDELVLSYAVSVHKSQGSEYPVVVMPVLTQHYLMLQRNLLYTAITRGKRLAVLVGTKKAIGIAVGNDKVSERFSYLSKRLQDIIS